MKSKLFIDQLFNGKDSKSVTVFPLRAVFRDADTEQQVLFSVSKRHFKRAVKRNRVKRQMREALRLNKAILHDRQQHIAFIWMTDRLMPTPRIERAMVKLLEKISAS